MPGAASQEKQWAGLCLMEPDPLLSTTIMELA